MSHIDDEKATHPGTGNGWGFDNAGLLRNRMLTIIHTGSVGGNNIDKCKISLKVKEKKNTYALKTPSVVALPFIYGVEYILPLY